MRKLRNGKLPRLTKAAPVRCRIQTLAAGFPRLDSSYYSALLEFKLRQEKKKNKPKNYKHMRSPILKTKSQSSKHS